MKIYPNEDIIIKDYLSEIFTNKANNLLSNYSKYLCHSKGTEKLNDSHFVNR